MSQVATIRKTDTTGSVINILNVVIATVSARKCHIATHAAFTTDVVATYL